MMAEAAIAMLACARIGAVHSVVFGGFAPASLAARLPMRRRRWWCAPMPVSRMAWRSLQGLGR
jgi:hypothetical protein